MISLFEKKKLKLTSIEMSADQIINSLKIYESHIK